MPRAIPMATVRPRSLANVLLDLKEAHDDWKQAVDDDDPDAQDRASEADTRVDDLRDEFFSRFHEATGLTWKQVEKAIEEAVL